MAKVSIAVIIVKAADLKKISLKSKKSSEKLKIFQLKSSLYFTRLGENGAMETFHRCLHKSFSYVIFVYLSEPVNACSSEMNGSSCLWQGIIIVFVLSQKIFKTIVAAKRKYLLKCTTSSRTNSLRLA